jgi:hypothetical protein
MATAAQPGDGRVFSIATVMNRAFGVIASNPLATLVTALLLAGLPQLLYYLLILGLAALNPRNLGLNLTLVLGLGLVMMLCAALAQAALVRAFAGYLKGERASIGACLATGLRKLLPLLGLSILMALGLTVGFLLIIVPGVILYVLWSVAFPALVADDLGVIESLGRSVELTKGARWRIFGLLALMAVMIWILSLVTTVFGIAGSGALDPVSMSRGSLPILYLAANAVTSTLILVFTASVQTSLYVTLREWKEGPQTDALAAIFA